MLGAKDPKVVPNTPNVIHVPVPAGDNNLEVRALHAATVERVTTDLYRESKNALQVMSGPLRDDLKKEAVAKLGAAIAEYEKTLTGPHANAGE